ncbi:MAG TPA: patatin-like phospholipase family protein [Methyloceanibacter sp.]|nr:patatin-like phospholipase family protein [Methyloceanibacter sp.]
MTHFGEKTVLVLQGGGALGAYQAGAYEALEEAGEMPTWVAGVSIGAINSAIIAGNPPERRVEKLRAFWEGVSSWLPGRPLSNDDNSRRAFNETSAALAALSGVPGFFSPRVPPAVLSPQGTRAAISIYDTAPLKDTLCELIDFDLLNSGSVRLSVGAVNVLTGNHQYFDTKEQRIAPDHVMASGALPPGFPPIEIDGEPFWDGGLVSNTPLQQVLEHSGPRENMCIFQIDLFSARGGMPDNLFEVPQREKEIRYSSRTRLNTDIFCELQAMRRAIRHLRGKLPAEFDDNPHWQLLDRLSCDAAVTIVQLIHRRAAYWTESNDYEFSRYSIDEHWQAGRADVLRTLNHPAWKNRTPPEDGVRVFDLTREIDTDPQERAM